MEGRQVVTEVDAEGCTVLQRLLAQNLSTNVGLLFGQEFRSPQLAGSLVVPEHMQEVSRDLVAAIDETQQGTFHPQRENDELTRALKNPEHPGRARGIGVVPWKVAWAGDPSYKTH